jgi:hypothetical protein
MKSSPMPSTAQEPGVPCAAAAVFGHRTHRIGQYHFQIRLHALKETRQAGQRAGRADAYHNGVQIVLGLRPDFRGGTGFVGQRVGRVVELVGEEASGMSLARRAATSW